jgi:hypothetical protein
MDINDAEKFDYAWGMWARGRSDGMAQAVEMIEKFLCREGMTAQQRDVLGSLYDSLLKVKIPSPWSL